VVVFFVIFGEAGMDGSRLIEGRGGGDFASESLGIEGKGVRTYHKHL
jgi:hypothetical protein